VRITFGMCSGGVPQRGLGGNKPEGFTCPCAGGSTGVRKFRQEGAHQGRSRQGGPRHGVDAAAERRAGGPADRDMLGACAEMDLAVALSSCPATGCNGGAPPRRLGCEVLRD